MNVVYVPAIPKALYYMNHFEGAPWHGCRGSTLFTILGECSRDNRCEICPYREQCEKRYREIIDSGVVVNWKETERHVARYLK